jgi:hypothetical protein
MNIMDGMDAARFASKNPGQERKGKSKSSPKKPSKMPQVLRNLNNR